MRQTKLFTKTLKESPKDEVSKNAVLLTKAGFIHKEMAGVYSYLPLGLRVLKKIEKIIREEINKIGGQEVFLTSLQDKELWETTDRWSDEKVDAWFKTTLKNGSELGLGWTHEEAITRIMKQYVKSYRDLPLYAYQLQTKFRNETRAKSGILRAREFIMKDLYSFSRNEEEHKKFYEEAKRSYSKIFNRCGIGGLTYITFASGKPFSKYSHEFQTITDAGEDTIYICKDCNVAINKEILEDLNNQCPECNQDVLEEKRSIEVGNIFNLKTKYSEPLGLTYADEDGSQKTVIMGSYGIGPGRLMGSIVEVLSDKNGLVWPESISPFDVHLVSLCTDEKDIKEADSVYEKLKAQGFEVLYDDRDGVKAGEKFADSDLIGIAKRVIVSPRTLKDKSLEIKKRSEKDSSTILISEIGGLSQPNA